SDHGLCGLLEEGAHGKSPKCLGGNLGDFGEFCKGLRLSENWISDGLYSKVSRQRLRSSESLKEWFERQRTRACIPHTPYTSVLKFVPPAGRIWRSHARGWWEYRLRLATLAYQLIPVCLNSKYFS
ncbi:TPA: hypothetical protein ACQWY9_002279, partial [Neisseria subflava]